MNPQNPAPQSPTEKLNAEFIDDARSQLSSLTGEVSARNRVIQTNDAYVYGDLLSRSLNVPVGHDFTPVNWLRRTVEIHRQATVGDGFTVMSSYHGVDVDDAFDPNAKPMLQQQNDKMKDHAEGRNKLFNAIMRDNGDNALWENIAENSSAVGTSILKGWYDETKAKYCLEMIESVEHFYSVWSSNNFRESDFDAYVYQISKEQSASEYNTPDNVATSPLGIPLAVLSSANTIEYISTQPMVTVMEINGKVQGWTSNNGKLARCEIGQEKFVNVVTVGNIVYQTIDEPKYMPKYYRFLNKKMRRRPWGQPDISDSAININQTYIEALSDWRTVQSRMNFPKYKAFGFGLDTQMPKPTPRTIEMIGLGEGQDIVPIQNPNSQLGSEVDFLRVLDELKQAYVREVGISAQLFDMPDQAVSNSNQAMLTSMKSISDLVESRRALWTPVIRQVFEDALNCLALWDDNIKELADPDEDWYIDVKWPPVMRKDDPTYQTMLLNRFLNGVISIQTFLERLGENAKEEIDRMSDEMDNPITAAIHGKMLSMLAEFKIAGPPGSAPPKVSVSLRGDLTPEQETNMSVQKGFGDGPIYGPTSGPQGELGIRATDDAVNQGHISGQGYNTGQPIIAHPSQGGQPPGASPSAPQTLTPPGNNQPGQQTMSAPGNATPNSPQGNINQNSQRKGK